MGNRGAKGALKVAELLFLKTQKITFPKPVKPLIN
jgi:hypothetical protein